MKNPEAFARLEEELKKIGLQVEYVSTMTSFWKLLPTMTDGEIYTWKGLDGFFRCTRQKVSGVVVPPRVHDSGFTTTKAAREYLDVCERKENIKEFVHGEMRH